MQFASVPPRWLARIEAGSAPLLLGSGPAVEVADRFTGRTGVYANYLDVDFDLEISTDPTTPLTRRGSLRVSAQNLNPADYAWSGATVDLYRWTEGALQDGAWVLHANITEVLASDPDSTLVVLSFEETIPVEGNLLDAAAVVSNSTFPAAGPGGLGTDGETVTASIGLCYPFVIGRPGYNWNNTYETIGPGSRLLYANFFHGALDDDYTIIVAHGGRVSTACRAADHYVTSQDNQHELLPLIELTDLEGRIITCIDTVGASTIDYPADVGSASNDWFIGWTEPAGRFEGKALQGAGDVILWALDRAQRHGRVEVDWPKLRAGVQGLNRFRIDTYINEQIGAWDWLTANLLPWLPVIQGRSGRGIWLKEWSPRALPEIQLRAGVNASRIAPLADVADVTPFTSLTVQGQQSAVNGFFARTVTRTSDPARVDAHPLLIRAGALYAARSETLSLSAVADEATLNAAAEWYIQRYALPRREVWYRLHWTYGLIEEGTRAALTDSDLGLSGVPCLVDLVRPAAGHVDLRVSLLRGPAYL